MAEDETGFEQMLNIWQEGQNAFFKAQKEVSDSFQKSLSGFNPAAMTPGAMGDMSSNFMDPTSKEAMAAWQSFIKSWAPDWDASTMMGMPNQSEMFGKSGEAYLAMLNAANWTQFAPEQLRIILESIAQGPQFADLATPQIDAAEAWRETLDFQKAAGDFAQVMQEAWARTFKRYSEKHTLEDLQSGNVQEALNAWLSAANAELMDVQRSAAFMSAQKRLLRASMEIKARQRDIAESWAEIYQLPTRTELDDLTKMVHELRRELRKVKRDLAAAKLDGAK